MGKESRETSSEEESGPMLVARSDLSVVRAPPDATALSFLILLLAVLTYFTGPAILIVVVLIASFHGPELLTRRVLLNHGGTSVYASPDGISGEYLAWSLTGPTIRQFEIEWSQIKTVILGNKGKGLETSRLGVLTIFTRDRESIVLSDWHWKDDAKTTFRRIKRAFQSTGDAKGIEFLDWSR